MFNLQYPLIKSTMLFASFKNDLRGPWWRSGNTLACPTSEVSSSNPGPCVRKLVVAYMDGQNFDQLYVLVSSAHKTTRHEITCTVLKVTYKTK